MAYGYAKEIQKRIGAAPDGTIFIVSDFSDVADSETIRRNLNRLVQAGTLRRILKGVFEKPKFSKLLGEFVAADPDAVAKALARCYHWTIAPCGDTALNMLGLSTQVTAVWSYISDGPYKTYEWDKTKIEFKHRTNKEAVSYTHLDVYKRQDAYFRYLHAIPAEKTHAGYFSVDKKGHMTNSKLGDRKAKTSDDADAYDLIMKNKELLLDLDPNRSPVRFIFSHSALREGWDNPNVFQICTLKQSSSEVRKRQEVGRGLRLCVNQAGERMDANLSLIHI